MLVISNLIPNFYFIDIYILSNFFIIYLKNLKNTTVLIFGIKFTFILLGWYTYIRGTQLFTN